MTTHIVVSHGADFFGEDRHPCKVLASLAGYAEGVIPAADRDQLVQLLRTGPAGPVQSIPAAQAAQLADQLRRIARHRFVKSKRHADAAALLADAAGRAAADGDAWEWRVETEQKIG